MCRKHYLAGFHEFIIHFSQMKMPDYSFQGSGNISIISRLIHTDYLTLVFLHFIQINKEKLRGQKIESTLCIRQYKLWILLSWYWKYLQLYSNSNPNLYFPCVLINLYYFSSLPCIPSLPLPLPSPSPPPLDIEHRPYYIMWNMAVLLPWPPRLLELQEYATMPGSLYFWSHRDFLKSKNKYNENMIFQRISLEIITQHEYV